MERQTRKGGSQRTGEQRDEVEKKRSGKDVFEPDRVWDPGLRAAMALLLALPVREREEAKRLAELGVPPQRIDNMAALAAALYQKAVKTGDVPAIREIRSILGDGEQEGSNGRLIELIQGMCGEKKPRERPDAPKK